MLKSDFRQKLLSCMISSNSYISYNTFDRSLALWLQRNEAEDILGSYPYLLRNVLHLIRRIFFPQPRRIEEFDMAESSINFWRNVVYEELIDHIFLQETDTIGFSVAFGEQLPECMFIARIVRRKYPNIKLVVGGSQITLLSQAQLLFLANAGLFDCIVIGYAELEISSIIASIKRGTCQIIRTQPLRKHNLFELPVPDFDSNELCEYFGQLSLPVLVSKGCYWGKCTFCDYAKMNAFVQAKYITRPVEAVFNEIIRDISQYPNVKLLLISDAVSPSFYRKIAQMAIINGVSLNTWSYMLNQSALDLSFFKLLSQAGVSTLNFGSETTCDRILSKMNKPARRADIINNIHCASDAGIKVVMNIIIDFPGITFKEAIKVADDIVELGKCVTLINPQLFDLTQDTYIAKTPGLFGIGVENNDPMWTSHGYHSLRFHRLKGLLQNQHEAILSIFQTLASKKRVNHRIQNLPKPTDNDMILFDKSTLLYFDNAFVVDIVSLRYRWECSEDEWKLFEYISSLPNRNISLSNLRDLWCQYMPRAYDTQTFEMWYLKTVERGMVEKIGISKNYSEVKCINTFYIEGENCND